MKRVASHIRSSRTTMCTAVIVVKQYFVQNTERTYVIFFWVWILTPILLQSHHERGESKIISSCKIPLCNAVILMPANTHNFEARVHLAKHLAQCKQFQLWCHYCQMQVLRSDWDQHCESHGNQARIKLVQKE